MKHAEVITKEEEDQLWREGVMNTTTPVGLQNAAFFVVGKMFCLRGARTRTQGIATFSTQTI